MHSFKKVTNAHKVTNLKRKNGDYKNHTCAVAGCTRAAKEEHHPKYSDSHYTISACGPAHHHILS
jgi:hypothetical protein